MTRDFDVVVSSSFYFYLIPSAYSVRPEEEEKKNELVEHLWLLRARALTFQQGASTIYSRNNVIFPLEIEINTNLKNW